MLVVATAVRAADSATGTQVRLNITLYDESAEAGRKVLVEPDVVVTLERPFSFHVGGELRDENVEDGLEFGTRVRGKIERQGRTTLIVRLSLALGNAISVENAPDVQLVRTESVDIRAPMTIGKVTRIPCGKSQTLEVEPVRVSAEEPNVGPGTSKTSPGDG